MGQKITYLNPFVVFYESLGTRSHEEVGGAHFGNVEARPISRALRNTLVL